MSNWADPHVAMAVRDLVNQIVNERLDTLRPVPRYGTVSAVDTATGTVDVLLHGENEPVTYPFSDAYLPAVGERIRINGPHTDRYAELASAGQYDALIGTIKWTIATTPDPGHVFMTGQTITNAQTLHTRLWSKAPSGMKSGANLILPDTRGRAFVDRHSGDADWDTIGELRGAKTHTLAISEMASHSHGGVTQGRNAAHTHNGTDSTYVRSIGGGNAYFLQGAQGLAVWGPYNSTSVDLGTETADHGHAVNAEGGGGAHNNIQPSVVFAAMLNTGLAGLS